MNRFCRLTLLAVGIWFASFESRTLAHGTIPEGTIEINYADLPAIFDKNSPRIKAIDARMRASAERQGHLEQSFRPKLRFHSSLEAFRYGSEAAQLQPTASAMASVNLYRGGQDRLQDEVNQSTAALQEAEKGALRKTKLAVIRRMFWEYLYSQRIIDIQSEAIQSLKASESGAKRRIAAGTAARSEAVEFELKIYELERARALAARKKEESRAELLAELGLEDQELHVDTPFESREFWEQRFTHKSSHHDDFLAKYKHQIAVKQLQIQRAESQSLPMVEAFAGLQQYNEREKEFERSWRRFEQVVGIGVSLDLDTSLSIQKEKSALASEISALEFERQADLLEIEKHLAIDGKEIEFLYGRVTSAPEHIALLEKHQKLTFEDYRYGAKGPEDVVQVIMEHLDARMEFAESVKELNSLLSHMESYFN